MTEVKLSIRKHSKGAKHPNGMDIEGFYSFYENDKEVLLVKTWAEVDEVCDAVGGPFQLKGTWPNNSLYRADLERGSLNDLI